MDKQNNDGQTMNSDSVYILCLQCIQCIRMKSYGEVHAVNMTNYSDINNLIQMLIYYFITYQWSCMYCIF